MNLVFSSWQMTRRGRALTTDKTILVCLFRVICISSWMGQSAKKIQLGAKHEQKSVNPRALVFRSAAGFRKEDLLNLQKV